ncbi:GDSL-type esterase/lipase family protein [Oribacterium sp. P6A1]|uniref:GDSL-type esterase/lipase family protein n=1 Tax=Oribacterium sp. P6A1 TaxID=1410612 RepID=UPI0005613360|nr:GDSL-type esterase/lipase family protein [Oribacterium sp. P6A1]
MKKCFKNCLTSLLLTGLISLSGFSAFADVNSSALTPSAAAGDISVSAAVAASNPTGTYFYAETPTLEQNDLLYKYFKNSVIVGDSIGCGWGLQCLKNSSDPVMGNFQSLAYPGFCVHSAFDASIEDAGTPMYKGAKRPVWESLQLMAADHPGETTHIYLHFGYKDQKWSDTPELYVKLIQTLQQYVPDSDVTILGASYMYPGKNGAPYTSANIKALNMKMQNYAAAYGWGYINLGDLLANSNGDLEPSYCSDAFMHLTPEAYDIWKKAMIGYAFTRMSAAGIC